MNTSALQLLPARVRQVIYVVYGLVALTAAATVVGYGSLELKNPPWLIVTTAVVGFLAVPFSAIASLNVTPNTGPDLPPAPTGAQLADAQADRQAKARAFAARAEQGLAPNDDTSITLPSVDDVDGDGRSDSTGRILPGGLKRTD